MLLPTHLEEDERELSPRTGFPVILIKEILPEKTESQQADCKPVSVFSPVKLRHFGRLDEISTHLSTFERCVPSQLSGENISAAPPRCCLHEGLCHPLTRAAAACIIYDIGHFLKDGSLYFQCHICPELWGLCLGSKI